MSTLRLIPNEFKKLQFIQAKNRTTSIWWAAGKMISKFLEGEKKIPKIGPFKVSLGSAGVNLITLNRISFLKERFLIVPPTFRTNLNGVLTEHHDNIIDDKKKTFKFGHWDVSLNDNELKLKAKNSNKTFILKHAVYLESYQDSLKPSKDYCVNSTLIHHFSDEIISSSATIKKIDQSGTYSRDLEFSNPRQVANIFRKFIVGSPETPIKNSDEELTDEPNSCGEMKLQFPMTVSLEGHRQKIQIKDTDNTLTFYHTVDIEAKEELDENIEKNIAHKRFSGILHLELESGDFMVEPAALSFHRVYLRQEVVIKIDLYSEVPSLTISPAIKRCTLLNGKTYYN